MLSVCFQEIKAAYEALFKITELVHIKKRAITCCPKLWLYLLNQVVMVAGNSCQRVSALNRGGSMLRLQVIEFFGRCKLPMQQYTQLKPLIFGDFFSFSYHGILIRVRRLNHLKNNLGSKNEWA